MGCRYILHWILEAIWIVYKIKWFALPAGVRAHSTRVMATSQALFREMSVEDFVLVQGGHSQKKKGYLAVLVPYVRLFLQTFLGQYSCVVPSERTEWERWVMHITTVPRTRETQYNTSEPCAVGGSVKSWTDREEWRMQPHLYSVGR